MPRHVPNLTDQLHDIADAAARRRHAAPGTKEHDAALDEMVRIQRELSEGAPRPGREKDEGGAISTPAEWHTPEG
jgi:hypothetical protein